MTMFTLLTVPVMTGVAILRYRLYDIDLVINRALVYGALTAVVAALYMLLVAGFGVLFQVSFADNLVVALLATGLIAVLFQPLRVRFQRRVDRMMYGQRRDPYEALSSLGERLETNLPPEAVLPTIVETVARAMNASYAEIALKDALGFRTAGVHGSPKGEPTSLSLWHGEEEVGRLLVSPPSPNEPFSPKDHRLLKDLASQAETAVHAVRLNADLKRSRERLVSTREDERRRLRRDLHDGLGPTLAGLTFGLEAARRLTDEKPEAAGDLLASLENRAQEAVVNVRRLVYELRPPALDDLGLVPAIRQQAESYGTVDGKGGDEQSDSTVFSFETPENLTTLPAATEVAVYRIAQEALTNVARHARAKACHLRLSAQESFLELEVSDDGRGIDEHRHVGVGLSSMKERAEELGGTCEIEPHPEGGTRVLARLPVQEDGAESL